MIRTLILAIVGLAVAVAVAATTVRFRDLDGRIHRSRSAVHRFHLATGHPHGWIGHVVDHVVPLSCGGPDEPINMQWQTLGEAMAKDRIERLPAALALEKEILACRKWRATAGVK